MSRITVGGIIKTSIVTAFTIAAALIWKDVIIGVIELIFPSSKFLLYQFIAALISTIFVVIAIYVILKTESEAEIVMRRFTRRKNESTKVKPQK